MLTIVTAVCIASTPLGVIWHNKIDKDIEKESEILQLSNRSQEFPEEPHPFWGRVKYIPGIGFITAMLRAFGHSGPSDFSDGY